MNNAIHCNKCFTCMHLQNGLELLILSCKHVLCPNCFESGVCAICQAPAKSMPINAQMPQNIRALFMDNNCKFKEIMDAEAFQFDQKLNYVSKYAAMSEEYEELKKEIVALDKQNAEADAEYEKEVALIKRLRETMTALERSPDRVLNMSNSSLLDISSGSSNSNCSTPSFLSSMDKSNDDSNVSIPAPDLHQYRAPTENTSVTSRSVSSSSSSSAIPVAGPSFKPQQRSDNASGLNVAKPSTSAGTSSLVADARKKLQLRMPIPTENRSIFSQKAKRAGKR
ncbi:RING finger protein narya-like [Culicoides brevitarsis]|uniref:RING finger protein narya-like n=1 Tax=Culicoides brevitarsis TaxID=469753 RepID=UPI00307C3710